MPVTRESLVAETRQNLEGAIKARNAKAIEGSHNLIQRLGGDRFTEQDDRAIKTLAEIDAVDTALYRHFNKEGALLYVGISVTITGRTKQHKHGAPWFREIDHIKLDWYGSRSSATRAEEAAIKAEKPLYNTTFNKGKPHGPEKRTPRAVRPSHRKREKPQ